MLKKTPSVWNVHLLDTLILVYCVASLFYGRVAEADHLVQFWFL